MERFDSKLRNLLGWEPDVVRVLRLVIPSGLRATEIDALRPGDTVKVIAVDPDGLGLTVRTLFGESLSLHPSEFEVTTWRPPSPVPAAGNVAGG